MPLGLDWLFPFPCWGNFQLCLQKVSHTLCFSLLLLGSPYNSNVGAFDIVPEVSETILSSFHSFYFILLFRSYFHHFIFQLTDSFCFSNLLIPSLVAQSVKSLPAVWQTSIRSLGQEAPLEKEMATHSSILAWRFP